MTTALIFPGERHLDAPAIRTEPVTACPLCGAAGRRTVLKGTDHDTRTGDYHIEQCDDCGMRYTNPRPIDEDLPLLYAGRTFDHLPRHRSPLAALREARLRSRVRKLLRWLPPRQLSCADLGTGDGFFASVVARMPFCKRMVAADFFEAAPPALQGTPAEYLGYSRFFGDPSRFDLVFARFVLEHVRDPNQWLAQIRQKLTPGGALMVEVPNWNATWRRLLGPAYSELSLPAHLLHFDPPTLRRLLADFDVRIFENVHGMVLARSIGNALGAGLARTGLAQLAITPVEIAVDLLGRAANMTAWARLRG